VIPDMPRKLPLFVQRERTRHGRVVFYFRRGQGERIRLPEYGSKEFDAAYRRILAGAPAEPAKTTTINSLAWLVKQYRQSSTYDELSPATRRQRDNIFHNVIKASGAEPFGAITRKGIKKSLEARKRTPSAARNFLLTMRGLFVWAVENEYLTEDPTEGVGAPKRAKGAGFPVWTEEDVAAFEARWPAGSKERVWLHVLLYTGLRRGDASVIGRQHVKDGVAAIKTEKSGYQLEAIFPVHPALAETLERGPTSDLAWVCGARGQPFTKEGFGNEFKKACVEAKLMNRSAHGLRKLCATRAAEAGLTVAEIEALFAWEGGRMASHYTKSANRRALAIQAAGKMANRNPAPPESGAGTGPKKTAQSDT
jgi:integrase